MAAPFSEIERCVRFRDQSSVKFGDPTVALFSDWIIEENWWFDFFWNIGFQFFLNCWLSYDRNVCPFRSTAWSVCDVLNLIWEFSTNSDYIANNILDDLQTNDIQMFRKFCTHDIQEELPRFAVRKRTFPILICHLLLVLHVLTKSYQTHPQAFISRIQSKNAWHSCYWILLLREW